MCFVFMSCTSMRTGTLACISVFVMFSYVMWCLLWLPWSHWLWRDICREFDTHLLNTYTGIWFSFFLLLIFFPQVTWILFKHPSGLWESEKQITLSVYWVRDQNFLSFLAAFKQKLLSQKVRVEGLITWWPLFPHSPYFFEWTVFWDSFSRTQALQIHSFCCSLFCVCVPWHSLLLLFNQVPEMKSFLCVLWKFRFPRIFPFYQVCSACIHLLSSINLSDRKN